MLKSVKQKLGGKKAAKNEAPESVPVFRCVKWRNSEFGVSLQFSNNTSRSSCDAQTAGEF